MYAQIALRKESTANKAVRAGALPKSSAQRYFSPDETHEEMPETQTSNSLSYGLVNFSAVASGESGDSESTPRRTASALPWPLQAKLVVGAVDDPLEREADRVAEQVMRMPEQAAATSISASSLSRHKCAACQADEKNEESRSKLSRKESAGAAPLHEVEVQPVVHEALLSPGEPLDPSTRAFFEPRFRYDFSRVRVHTNARAAASAQAVHARAYTVGQAIAFANNMYSPQTRGGRRLLAHELAHVVQQNSNAAGAGSRGPLVERPLPDLTRPVLPRLQRASPPAPPAPPSPGPAPARWTPKVNPFLRAIANSHPTLTDEQKKALEKLDTDPVSYALEAGGSGKAWENLDWDKVSQGAAERVFAPEKIHQHVLGVCGPAAAVNAQAMLAPASYAELVVKVFMTGKVGSYEVNKKLRQGTPHPSFDQVDWMVLSAVQDANHVLFEYHGSADPSEKRVRDSHTPLQVEADLKVTGCKATKTYYCLGHGELEAAQKASDLLYLHPKEIEVAIFVDAEILQNPNKRKISGHANHFIRLIPPELLPPITVGERSVSFRAFTWGHVNSYSFSVSQFKHLVSAFVVGTRDEKIAL